MTNVQGTNNLIEDASMLESFQSEAFTLVNKDGFSIHAVFTGSPNGSFFIAVSIDGRNWAVLPDSTQVVTEAGDVFWNVTDSKYQLARLHYTRSSGSGTCDASYATREAV